MKLRISDLVIDSTIQIRRGNHEQTIQRYEEAFDKLPPIDVFDTPEGMLLGDGFHRIAAAERLGLAEIEVTVRKGTRADALEWAVIANTKNADPLSSEERDAGIRRLKQLHPDWAYRQIADAMSVSHQTVKRACEIDEVKREVVVPVTRVTNSHYREVAAAPREQWQPLIKAAEERGWSRDVTALAVRNLRDDRIPDERKRAILAGEADPIAVTPDGQFAVPAEVIGRQLREMEANDALLALERALETLARLRLFSIEAIVSTAGRARLDRLIEEMPGYVEFLTELREAARAERGKLKVVS